TMGSCCAASPAPRSRAVGATMGPSVSVPTPSFRISQEVPSRTSRGQRVEALPGMARGSATPIEEQAVHDLREPGVRAVDSLRNAMMTGPLERVLSQVVHIAAVPARAPCEAPEHQLGVYQQLLSSSVQRSDFHLLDPLAEELAWGTGAKSTIQSSL